MTNTLDDIMADVPVYEAETEEESHIDLNKEYFAVTNTHFLIYNKDKKCWYCLKTKLVIPGNICDIIDEEGTPHLYTEEFPKSYGKWGLAATTDDILDFYNSGEYIGWLKENTQNKNNEK